MADDSSLSILRDTTNKACSPMELIHECGLPPSTIYRRINEFVDAGLVTIERVVVTEEGKKFNLYRSAVKDICAEYRAGRVEVTVSLNEDVVSKLSRMWTSMRTQK
jgi:predicted transcriptional regulator